MISIELKRMKRASPVKLAALLMPVQQLEGGIVGVQADSAQSVEL